MSEMLKVYQDYHPLEFLELADLVRKILEQQEDNPDPALRKWLANYCLTELRPRSLAIGTKEWCRWIALVLRYVQPLMTNNPPTETKPMAEVMRNRPEVIQALMFGSNEAMSLSLQAAYEIHLDYRRQAILPDMRDDQRKLFEEIKNDIQRADIRTLTGWSRYYLDAKGSPLARRVFEALHHTPQPSVTTLIQMIGDTHSQNTEYSAKFEAFLARAAHGRPDLIAQTLWALNEYERRKGVLLTYSRLFMYSALAFLLFVASGAIVSRLPEGTPGSLIATIGFGIGALDAVFIWALLVVLFLSSFETYSWANTSLKTLGMLMGAADGEVETNLADWTQK